MDEKKERKYLCPMCDGDCPVDSRSEDKQECAGDFDGLATEEQCQDYADYINGRIAP